MSHDKDCNWEKCDCSYKETHNYCPHPEHACTCKRPKIATMDEVIQELEYQRDKEKSNLIETQKIGGHSCYGAGVEWGAIDLCDRMLEFIKDPDA